MRFVSPSGTSSVSRRFWADAQSTPFDHDEPRRVGRAHDAERVREDGVPFRGREGSARLVEQLEDDGLRRAPVPPGDLAPEGAEARPLCLGVLGELLVVVHVHDDGQIVGEGLIDGPVDPREEGGVDRVGRARPRVRAEPDREPDMVESRLPRSTRSRTRRGRLPTRPRWARPGHRQGSSPGEGPAVPSSSRGEAGQGRRPGPPPRRPSERPPRERRRELPRVSETSMHRTNVRRPSSRAAMSFGAGRPLAAEAPLSVASPSPARAGSGKLPGGPSSM